jgi:hypothetical protein
VPTEWALGTVAGLLALSVLASVVFPQSGKNRAAE